MQDFQKKYKISQNMESVLPSLSLSGSGWLDFPSWTESKVPVTHEIQKNGIQMYLTTLHHAR